MWKLFQFYDECKMNYVYSCFIRSNFEKDKIKAILEDAFSSFFENGPYDDCNSIPLRYSVMFVLDTLKENKTFPNIFTFYGQLDGGVDIYL